MLGLGKAKGKQISKYSLAVCRRCASGQKGFMEGPKLLIMDEPLNGLDK